MADETLPSDRLKELLARIDPQVLQQVMPLTGGVITMMFTDIVDSTRIKAEIGDRPYFDEVLKRHNELVQDSVARHNGHELKAIGCFEAALRVRTERELPVDRATTQNNLGIAYANLPTGDRGVNLQQAIACYEAAIRGYAAAGLTKEADEVRQRLASLRQQQ
jgi:hypothetical protein